MKWVGLAVFFLTNVAMAQAHLRAGVGGEIGPVVFNDSWAQSYFSVMTGPTGKIGVDFRLNPRWVAAVYYDGAINFFPSFDRGRDGGFLWWHHVAFELRKHKLLLAAGPGFAFYCGFNTCSNYPAPGAALMARIGYEVVQGAHDALSIGLDARFLFQGPPPPFNGLAFTVVPAFMIGWEHQ